MRSSQPSTFRWLVPPFVVGLAWIVCVGTVDWLTGPELSLSAFYLPGVALVAWFSDRKQAVVIAFCAGLAWLLAELTFHLKYSNAVIPYWNGTIRLSFFLITAFLTAEVRKRQQTEAALREHDKILKSILDSMGDGVVVVGDGGTILAFNPAAEDFFACNPIGRDANAWVKDLENPHPDETAQDPGKFTPLRLAMMGQLSGSLDFSLRLPGEEETKELELTALPLLGEQSEPTGVVIVIADHTSRRTMEKRIAEASEREQRRIGQELHDGVCQHLVGVAFAAGSLQDTLESRRLTGEAAAAGEIATLINDAIGEARSLAHGLYPTGLEEGLEVALRTLASTTQERTGIVCRVTIDGGNACLDPVSALHLYRIAQECISNACRHAAPEAIAISLVDSGSHLRLEVTDNGTGMEPSPPNTRGIGISLMKHRTSLMGGTFEMESNARHGTRITCTLPCLPTFQSNS